MDKVREDGQASSGDVVKLSETRFSRPNEALALSQDDIAAVMKDIEGINKKLIYPSFHFGMVFDAIVGWETTKDNGEKVRVAVKKPRSVSAEKIESDMSKMQRKLMDVGEDRFAPTYCLPGQELLVQRLIDARPWDKTEQNEFWNDITKNKGYSVSQFDSNVLCDKKYGPVIIDVLNVHFSS